MGKFARFSISLAVFIYLVFPLLKPDCQAADPVLGRLSFWVQPERMSGFEVIYHETFAPILKRHGLVESSTRGRETRPEVFSRLFELKTPSDAIRLQEALVADTTWTQALRDLEEPILTIGPAGRTFAFQIYAVPFAPGRTVPAGPGVRRPAGPGRGHWRTYSIADGLAGTKIGAILQDREGYLWVGTTGGEISRYDGNQWTTLTARDGLVTNGVRAFIQDRKGDLWFATGNGLTRYRSAAGEGMPEWTTYSTRQGLLHNCTHSVLEDRDGNLWIGTDGGVSRYDGKTFTSFTSQDGMAAGWVNPVFQDRDGNLWFGTDGGGVSRYNRAERRSGKPSGKGTFTTFTTRDGLADNTVRTIFQDREGYLWFAFDSQRSGVTRYDGKAWKTFTTEEGLAGNLVFSILEDRDGNLWFATNGGASRYDGKTFTSFTTRYGLAKNFILSISQDRDGDLWFGTDGLGVTRYDGGTFTSFSTANGLSDGVRTILRDEDGHFWFGTNGGLVEYDGEYMTTFTTGDGLVHNAVAALLQDREGNLWIGTGGGVSRYDGTSFTSFTTDDGLVGNRLYDPSSICLDRNGNLWIGTRGGGVSRYDGRGFTSFTVEDGLAGNSVRTIFQDRDGTFWFSTNEGTSRYDPSAGAGADAWTTFTTADGLGSGTVQQFLRDRDGTLWAGTWGGLSRFDGHRFANFSRADGLAHDQVRALYQDTNGHLWIGTYGGGVSRYDGQVFQTLTEQDGLAGADIYDIEQDANGDYWFASTSKGITRYRPLPPLPPPVFVDAVVADRRYDAPSELSLSSTAALIAFEFHGTSLRSRPGGLVYRYRLKGQDKTWQNTRATRVEYKDLPRGSYTFEVQAVDRDLVYSETPAAVALTVRLPYERIGLLSALGIAVVLIGWQTVRVVRRDRRLQAANTAMSEANKELFQANVELTRERATEHIRAHVQTMEQASDFDRVLSLVSEDLKAVGLSFDTCGIDVLEEPVETPTMTYFESHGFRYTAYTSGPDAQVSRESYHLSAPFPPMNRGPIERFTTGGVWQGRDMDLGAVMEVPIAHYGRLRLTSQERSEFTDDDVVALKEFASAIALGYARVLDFQELETANREIQEQTERKSAFLASMGHELRTPMNAIKGFTNLVLRRRSENLTDRQRENLGTVVQASDHLLAMINDLMDLSKIEAGRMDVDVGSFDVKVLVASCCATVSPLLAEKPNVKLSYDVPDDVGEANTDQARVRQMLINLLSNAIKFTDSGGVTVRSGREDGQLVIAVADTGRGIPTDEIDTIFDEYRQVKGSDKEQQGTGLGLSITSKFAELLGGSIRVESEVGTGSTFIVRIPMIYGEG